MYYREQKIINDIGILKILLFTTGILLYFISNFFITYSTYIECSLNFFFKHIGTSMILFTFYIYITINSELGVDNNKSNNKKFLFESCESMLSNLNDENDDDIGKCNNILYKMSIKNNDKTKNNTIIQKLHIEFMENDEAISKIKTTRSIYKRILFFYFLYQLFVVILIFDVKYDNKKTPIEFIHDKNEDFTHRCILENTDLLFYSLDLFIYMVIIVKEKKIENYRLTFTYIKYIEYSSFIGIAFGPSMNITLYL